MIVDAPFPPESTFFVRFHLREMRAGRADVPAIILSRVRFGGLLICW